MTELHDASHLKTRLNLRRCKKQGNGLFQERFSATYANTNPNFVFQNIPDKVTNDAVLLSILQVIDNILCRGTVTPPSEFLCRNYLRDVLYDDSADAHIDFSKWNKWKQKVAKEKINTYSRELPHWEKTIKGGHGINGDVAYHFYHDILPQWFEKIPVVQFTRPEVRFDEISQEATCNGFLNSEVDFYLEQAGLIIEIDGEQHKNQTIKDANRRRFLKKAGCTEVRIPTSAFSSREELEKHHQEIQEIIDKSGFAEMYRGYEKLAKRKDTYQKRKALDIILRFELLLVSLIKHEKLPINAQTWKLFLNDAHLLPLCRIAYDDIQIWFENIATMCDYPTKLPDLEFCNSSEADTIVNFEYNKCWTDEALDNPEEIFVRNDYFENSCYYELQDAEMLPYRMIQTEEDHKEQHLFFLRNFFGYAEFKEGQRQIIGRALARKDTIGILPTGSGKSLCYQLVGLLQPGITMTICPLVALIKDQKRNLDLFGVDRTSAVHSEQTGSEKSDILQKLQTKQISFIWISPERFQIESFRDELQTVGKRRVIKYAVLDEVHCLSEWGHDFRTAYLVLVDTIRKYCGKECVLYGLTATASDFVLKDILRTFSIAKSSVISSETMHRPELNFHIVTANTGERYSKLKSILKEIQAKYADAGNIFEPHGDDSICGIVFTVYAKGKEFGSKGIADALDHDLVNEKKYIRYFNSKMTEKEDEATKNQIQNMYMNNEIPLLVATKAFGMGINKSNVRYTIHQSLPWSSEAFYQEAGRAGRSSDPAKKDSDCYIIYSKENVAPAVLDKLFDKNTPVEEVKRISSGFQADLSPIFFLWGQNNFTVAEELKHMESILSDLRAGKSQLPIIQPNIKEGNSNSEKKQVQPLGKIALEKTLYHLSLLGFVKEWTIDYSSGEGGTITVIFDEEAVTPNEKRILKNLYTYIRRYDPTFTLEGNRADYAMYRQIRAKEDADFTSKYMEILLKWTEANIVYYRKRSIANMISDIENSGGDGERLKSLIEKRFVIVQEESALARIQNRDMHVKTWFDAFVEEDADTAIAVLQRHIETNQNNPAVNYVLSLLQLTTNRESAYGLESYLASSLEMLEGAHDRKAVTDFAIQVAKESQISEKNLDILGGCLAKAYPEHARYVHMELGDKGSLCAILTEQISTLHKLGGIL